MSGATTWSALLDEMSESVEAALQLLGDDGGVPPAALVVTPWSPPERLGPCPTDLVGRARDVLRSQADLEEGLARRMAAVGREVQAGHRRTLPTPSQPRGRVVDHLA